MPLELHIIRAQEFIQMGAHGHFDLAASKAALANLVRACQKRNIDQALLDLRDLQFGPKPVYSPADLAELVSTFREIGFTHRQRLAILYRSDPYHRTRMFAFLSTMHGWHVKAFQDFEEAFLWLSGGAEPESKRKRSATEKTVPVRVGSSAVTHTVHVSHKGETSHRKTPPRPRAARAA